MTSFDVERVREDFPNLSREVQGKPLIYLDNAATTLKAQVVIDAVTDYYAKYSANVHRGVHTLSEEATIHYEGTREKVRSFINARDKSEIIFTSGTTAAINLVAQSFGRSHLREGDEVLISQMEHHSNIVPWQILADQIGIVLKVAPMNEKGELIWDEFEALVNEKTKLISIVAVSNSLGTINPYKKITSLAKSRDIPVLLDAAQLMAHAKLDVQALECDFVAFSGHKMFGPTGVGVLYGRRELLKRMPPVIGGGDMIRTVSFEKSTYADIPYKFEAGTPNIAGVIGLGAAVDYIRSINRDSILAYERELLAYGTEQLQTVDGLKLIGTAENKNSILAFILDGVHPHDIGSLLNMDGIAIRAGHHCTQPVMQYYGVPATARASLSIYNRKEDIDHLVVSLKKAREMFI